MTQRIRYATSHIHELGAEIQRRVLEGYILDTSSAFCIKRQGSAYVAHFLPTRESLDYGGFPLADSEEKELEEFYKEAVKRRLEKTSASEEDLYDFNLKDSDKKSISELKGIVKDLTIHEKWEIDDQINFEADQKKKLAESESCGRIVYTKEQLDAMHWDQLKPMLDQAGIRGRRRANMIRDFLKKQEEEGEG